MKKFILLCIYVFTATSFAVISAEENDIFKVDEVKLYFDKFFTETLELLKKGETRKERQLSEEVANISDQEKVNSTNFQNDTSSHAKPTSIEKDPPPIQNDIVFNNFPQLPGNDIPIFWDNERPDPQAPIPNKLFWLFAPLVRKVSNIIAYLSHPNVALTPAFLLAKLRDKWQKIHKHIVEKIGGYNDNFEDYPFPYRKYF